MPTRLLVPSSETRRYRRASALDERPAPRFRRRVPSLRSVRILEFLVVGLLVMGFLVVPSVDAQTLEIDPELWWTATAPGVALHTNSDPQRGLEVALALARFRAVFAQLAPDLELRSPAPTTILAFRDATDYAPFKTRPDREGARILGQFLAHGDGSWLTLDAGTRLAGSYAVIFHETVHYFVRHNFPRVPLWFNEGLAEYYSTFESDGDRVRLGGAVERHLEYLSRDGNFELSTILEARTDSATYHEPGEVGRFYALSWLLVHYLLSGDGDRIDRTADLLARLAAGDDPEDALAQAFDLGLGELEEALAEHLVALPAPIQLDVADLPGPESVRARRLAAADLFAHLGDVAGLVGRRRFAEDLYDRALVRVPDHAGALGGLAFLRDLAGRHDEAGVLYGDLEDRPGNRKWPRAFLGHGRHLVARAGGQPPEVRDARLDLARGRLETALELYPDYGEAWFLLGTCELLAEEPHRQGVRALERAHALLPARSDVVSNLARLHARRGEAAPARRWVEGELSVFGDSELVEKTRDEVERLLLVWAAAQAMADDEIDEALGLFDQAIEYARDPRVREAMEAQLLALQEAAESQ